MPHMSMGKRETDQSPLWIAVSDLPASPGHPFYARLNAVLDAHRFDRFVEGQLKADESPRKQNKVRWSRTLLEWRAFKTQ